MLLREYNAKTGWSDADIRPFGPLSLPPSASIFHYGMAIFEGLKAYNTETGVRIFRPELNIARMNVSARRMALPEMDEDEMMHLMKAYVRSVEDYVPDEEVGELYLRPTLIATDERIGVRRSESALFFIVSCPVSAFFTGKEGVRLLATTEYMRAYKGGVGFCKTGGNYANSIMPMEKGAGDGYDQILWLGENGTVTEVGMMNVFFVKRSDTGFTLLTPALDGTILDGVTRRSIIELCPKLGYGLEERLLSIDEIVDGVRNGSIVETFGSGTAAVVAPVRSIAYKEAEVQVDSVGVAEKFRKELCELRRGDGEWMVAVGEDVGHVQTA